MHGFSIGCLVGVQLCILQRFIEHLFIVLDSFHGIRDSIQAS